ncbi:MAG: DNA repair protein RecN, partial [Oscillospiraceae bacterium]|nr:DNA repair protein RecN [Oscillospiraceae bacterium]
KIKRKYCPTIKDVNNNLKEFKDELEKIEMYDVRQNELIVSQKAEMKQVETLGAKLSEQRKKTADIFTKAVSDELAFLDMKGVVLKVMIMPHEPGSNGLEDVEFLISTNVGEPPKPIYKIASGGELSRIMLSIKNTLADKDQIPTLVFDEIDTGVSGLAAQKIGLKLKQAAKHRQVLCVTHLAQIAALADEHFKISKTTLKGRTFTAVTNLDKKGRIEEVARIMSAGSITDLTLETAQEMIEKGQKV